MPNDRMLAPPETLFEYIIKALVPRSKNAINLRAFNVAREKIAQKRKEKQKRGHLRLAYSSNNTR